VAEDLIGDVDTVAGLNVTDLRHGLVSDSAGLARTSRRWTLERGILAQDARVQLA
jgi:hypothetical protein